jgi:hypothetical protein
VILDAQRSTKAAEDLLVGLLIKGGFILCTERGFLVGATLVAAGQVGKRASGYSFMISCQTYDFIPP